jgi:hypothetical protein
VLGRPRLAVKTKKVRELQAAGWKYLELKRLSPRQGLHGPLAEITDLAGIRIIVESLDKVGAVAKMIEQN